MNRLLQCLFCIFTLSVQNAIAAPAPADIRRQVQMQIDSCVVPVTCTLKWKIRAKAESFVEKTTGVVISPSGAVLVHGDLGPSLVSGLVGETSKTVVTSNIQIKMTDGRSVLYKLKSHAWPSDISVLVPLSPLAKTPYIDISKLPSLPLGLPVYAVYQQPNERRCVLTEKTVVGVPGNNTPPNLVMPERLLFSIQTGQFAGWGADQMQHEITVWEPDQSAREFIQKNTGIKISLTGLLKEPVDPAYQRVYDRNRNSMGKLRYMTRQNNYSNGVYYVLTSAGDVIVELDFDAFMTGSVIGQKPATATLADGSKCLMKWNKIDKANGIAFLTPTLPLKQPLKPIVWRNGKAPQIGEIVYGCYPNGLFSGRVYGFDPAYSDRFLVEAISSMIFFDTEGRAVSLRNSHREELLDTTVFDGVTTTTGLVQGLMPGLKLVTETETKDSPTNPLLTKLPSDIRNWGFVLPDSSNPGEWTSTAVCIDDNGYYVIPDTSLSDGTTAPKTATEPTAEQIRSAYTSLDNQAELHGDQGLIGKVAIIYRSPKLDLSILKLKDKPARAIKAIEMPVCKPPVISEPLYGMDVSIWNGRLMHLYIPHKLLEASTSPFTGCIDTHDDQGGLCYSLDGQVRGYVTDVMVSSNTRKTMLVDLAEIAKALAIVKKAMGD